MKSLIVTMTTVVVYAYFGYGIIVWMTLGVRNLKNRIWNYLR